MAWSALIRSWDGERKMYHTLVLRIEDTKEPGCLLRLYDGERPAGDVVAESPQVAMAKAVELARSYLNDPGITEDSLAWVQAR